MKISNQAKDWELDVLKENLADLRDIASGNCKNCARMKRELQQTEGERDDALRRERAALVEKAKLEKEA